jgi:protein TonB
VLIQWNGVASWCHGAQWQAADDSVIFFKTMKMLLIINKVMKSVSMFLKVFSFVVVLVLSGGLSKSQAAHVKGDWSSAPADTTETKIWCNPEVMPSFPGGTQKLMQFISDNLRWPEGCEDFCIQGKVVVSFIIEKDGRVTEPKVVRSLDPAFDKEALRIVNLMPKWNPYSINGERRRMKYTIPISFKVK